MKYLAAALAFASAAAAAAPGSQPADLRRVLQQYHPTRGPAPRELSPVERAELRRQLIEFKQRPSRQPQRRR
jgi:hypothetical protein